MFEDSRERVRVARLLAESEPSQMAKSIVANRAEISVMDELKAMAKEMRVSRRELAAEILIERNLNGAVVPKPRAEFEAGFTEIENKNRRSIVRGTIYAEKATRPDYRFGAELLKTIGRDYGVVISSVPSGEITVYSVKRAVNPEYAALMANSAIEAMERNAERIDAAEKAIAACPLNKVPPAFKRELEKAFDAMAIARARVERANKRLADSKAISAENLRLESVATYDAENAIPGTVAIESLSLPANIVRRPFRESLRIKARASKESPVEMEIVRRETKLENAIARKAIREYVNNVIFAEKASAEKQELEKARAERNAAYRMRQAESARARRARNKK